MLHFNCADFGTSRDITKVQATQCYTVGVGTPVYMAPVEKYFGLFS